MAAGVVVVVGVAGVAVWSWPVGLVAERPGGILDLDQRVAVDPSATTTEVDGLYDGLTVELTPMTAGTWLVHQVTRDPSQVLPVDEVQPSGIDPGVYQQYEKAQFVDGGQIAAAVAEQALGYQTSVTSDGVEVLEIEPGAPSAGQLLAGDTITGVNGAATALSADLQQAIQGARGGAVTLTVNRSGVEREVSVIPAAMPGSPNLVLGVLVASSNPKVDLQIPVTVDSTGVVGPSAGLMTALTIYDKLSPTDLAAGRHIAGTGTLSDDGSVGEIGGIQAKARAAEAAGADLFLAPATQADDARAVLGDRIPVVGVTSFADAVAALSH